ncbi:MAG: hypothetical protein MHM6MM_004785 [Cercozoa sp. M6MM]
MRRQYRGLLQRMRERRRRQQLRQGTRMTQQQRRLFEQLFGSASSAFSETESSLEKPQASPFRRSVANMSHRAASTFREDDELVQLRSRMQRASLKLRALRRDVRHLSDQITQVTTQFAGTSSNISNRAI